jgi:hypothetical protein
LVFIGKISYSLYLWHWPLLVLIRYLLGRQLNGLETAALVIVCFAISALSWRYVEQPFRGRASRFDRTQIFAFAALGSTFAACLGFVFVQTNGLPGRFSPEVRHYTEVVAINEAVRPECFNRTALDVRMGKLCRIGASSNAQPSFIVWGDSHSDRIVSPVEQIAKRQGRTGLMASVGACPPLLGVDAGARGCDAFNDEVLGTIERLQIKQVVLSADWANYVEAGRFGHARTARFLRDRASKDSSPAESRRVFARALTTTVARLIGNGRRVVLVGPIPEIEESVPEGLARAKRFGGSADIGPLTAEFRERQAAVFGVLHLLERWPGVRVVYPDEVLCRERCAVLEGDMPLYIDDNHLSRFGLQKIRPALERVF